MYLFPELSCFSLQMLWNVNNVIKVMHMCRYASRNGAIILNIQYINWNSTETTKIQNVQEHLIIHYLEIVRFGYCIFLIFEISSPPLHILFFVRLLHVHFTFSLIYCSFIIYLLLWFSFRRKRCLFSSRLLFSLLITSIFLLFFHYCHFLK